MPNEKQLANLKPFKKGNNANPLGAKAHNGPKAMVRKLTREELVKMINTTAYGTVADLKKIAEDKDSTALEVALATCMVKFINRGDFEGLKSFLEQAVGRLKNEVDVTSGGEKINTLPQVHVYLPSNGKTKEENNK